MEITYQWRGPFESAEMHALHAAAFDFEDHLRPFSFDACGFAPTNAGLIAL